jgi:hypothetical protein
MSEHCFGVVRVKFIFNFFSHDEIKRLKIVILVALLQSFKAPFVIESHL